MPTPSTDTKVQSETLEQIADRIAATIPMRSKQAFGREQVKIDILSALRNEREACAKVAETAFAEFQTGHNAGKWIAKAIREGR